MFYLLHNKDQNVLVSLNAATGTNCEMSWEQIFNNPSLVKSSTIFVHKQTNVTRNFIEILAELYEGLTIISVMNGILNANKQKMSLYKIHFVYSVVYLII